jgi:Tfp pilus assembly protein PilX
MALVLVVGSMLVLAMLALTALAFSVQSQRFARYTQDYSGGMAAAQSGIEDYISRLNRDDGYGNALDCTNLALQGPMPAASNTCGWTTTTEPGWLPVVPGETDVDAAHFHYSVDATRSRSEGTIIVTSTGRVNGEYRTVEAAVGKGGSTDYVYYTDFESADPSNVQAYTPSGATDPDCGSAGYDSALYWYEGRRYSGCKEITFISGDHLYGAVFSNDAVLSNGGNFHDGFSSANPGCSTVTGTTSTWRNCLRQDGKNSTANFYGIRPQLSEPLYLDDTSAAFATYPGCHYYGSTRVIFNANGTMTVWNKKSNNGDTAPTAIPAPGLPTPTCGTLDALDSASGATVPVPDPMVVYVDDAPAAVPRRQCDSGEIGGPSGRTLPLGTYDRAVNGTTGTSQPGYNYDTNMFETTKTCASGNLYLEGTLNGRVTVASAQSIIATGDVVLAGGRNGDDMLGLVATNSVEVFHPQLASYVWVKRNAQCGTSGSTSYRYCIDGTSAEVSGWPKRYVDPTTGGYNPSAGIQIAGSIQTLQHSFLVQKYNLGPQKGTLNVFGSIAQRWRGIVGQTDSWGNQHGYNKLYEYDSRLVTSAPPYFPRWVNSQWSLRYSGELSTPGELKTP